MSETIDTRSRFADDLVIGYWFISLRETFCCGSRRQNPRRPLISFIAKFKICLVVIRS